MYIIAEIGSNWRTLDDCKESIRLAKEAGADAVKFQIFNTMSLYGQDLSSEFELPRDWVPLLSEEATKQRIDFGVTAFCVDDYKFVDPYVDYHKVASSNMLDYDSLDYLSTLDRRVFISTGGARDWDQMQCLANHELAYKHTTVFMDCVAEYPSNKYMPSNLAQHSWVAFGEVGLSDHSSIVCHNDAILDAYPYIEKHVNLVGAVNTPDSGHSLSLEEFKLFVKWSKGKIEASSILGTYAEKEMKLYYNVRAITTKPLKSGDTLISGTNFRYMRARNSLGSKGTWKDVRGKKVTKDYIAGEGITCFN